MKTTTKSREMSAPNITAGFTPYIPHTSLPWELEEYSKTSLEIVGPKEMRAVNSYESLILALEAAVAYHADCRPPEPYWVKEARAALAKAKEVL